MRGVATRILLALAIVPAAVGCATPGGRPMSPWAKLEQSMVFVPARYPEGNWRPAGLAAEDVWFEAEDGTRLHGWYCPRENPKAVVLFAHGNAGNVTHRADVLRVLLDRLGVAVLAFDYRGFGRSGGSPDEAGVLQDARAARQWLAHREGIRQSDVVLMGRSLGGAVVVDLAAADGARGLILESTFTSLPEAAAVHLPWAPTKLLMHNRLNSLAKIGNYRGPLLHSHGDADRVIPFEHGRRLFAAANEPKRFVTIRGRDHNDPQTPEYYQALEQFLAEL